MVRKASFRIRRRYYDQIVSGEKREELRSNTAFWRCRLIQGDSPEVAVFLCGRDVHRRWITDVYVGDPVEVLGRPLSDQGSRDIYTDSCIVICLGDEYHE